MEEEKQSKNLLENYEVEEKSVENICASEYIVRRKEKSFMNEGKDEAKKKGKVSEI